MSDTRKISDACTRRHHSVPSCMTACTIVFMCLAAISILVACAEPSGDKAQDATTSLEAEMPTDATVQAPSSMIRMARSLSHLSFGRRGAGWGPGMPGWARIAATTPNGPWGKVELTESRTASWLRGPGGRIALPVGDEGPTLRWLSLWLYPITRNQAVSVFVDEQLVKTIALKPGWHRYDLALPQGGLTVGEHDIRLWFRHVRYRGRLKTPGALGGIALAPDLNMLELVSSTDVLESALHPQRLVAGAPSRWFTHVVPTKGSRLTGRMAVNEGPSTQFVVRIAEDGRDTHEVGRFKLSSGASRTIDIDLNSWAGRLVRLQFVTEGQRAPISNAQWLDLKLTQDYASPPTMGPIRNLVVWTIEGMWSNGPSLGRDGAFAEMPNLSLMQANGQTALHVWMGTHSAVDAHRRLLSLERAETSLVDGVSRLDIESGFFATGDGRESLAQGFDTRHIVAAGADESAVAGVLDALSNWLKVRRTERFFAYVNIAAPKKGRTGVAPSAAYQVDPMSTGGKESRTAARRGADTPHLMNEYFAHLNFNDLWLGELMSRLRAAGRENDTAILIVGIPSHEVNPFRNNALDPIRLFVPAILWRPTEPAAGGTLTSPVTAEHLKATILAMLGRQEVTSTMADRVWFHLQSRRQPLSDPLVGHTAFGAVVNYGHWALWPNRRAAMRLWQKVDDSYKPVSPDKYPIIVRALSDRIAEQPVDN